MEHQEERDAFHFPALRRKVTPISYKPACCWEESVWPETLSCGCRWSCSCHGGLLDRSPLAPPQQPTTKNNTLTTT